MTLNDPLSNALSKVLNAEKIKKDSCTIFPSSTIIRKILEILQDHHYLGEAKVVEHSRGNYLEVNLLGRINHCGSIKPRFSVKRALYEKYEKRFLPAKNFGILIISTSKGIMTHEQAKTLGLGGKLLAFCY